MIRVSVHPGPVTFDVARDTGLADVYKIALCFCAPPFSPAWLVGPKGLVIEATDFAGRRIGDMGVGDTLALAWVPQGHPTLTRRSVHL